MITNDLSVTFFSNKVLKHFRKGKKTDKFEYMAYSDKNTVSHLMS